MNWHKFASIALGIGAFCATKFIPAACVLTLGPVGIPVAAAVSVALTGLAAVGIVPSQVSPTIATFIGSIGVKKNA